MNAVSTRFFRTARTFSVLFALLACVPAMAQNAPAPPATLAVSTTAAGNHAEIIIGAPANPLAEVTLDFQDATGLSPASLGASAQIVSLSDAALQARLPHASLTSLSSAFPVMLTIEPPATGGLSFRGTGRMEIHTHALPYTVGSFFRVFKAPLGGAFQDVTDEIAEGSVRARTTYGGFSQFLIVVDLRSSGAVVTGKIGALRDQIATLPMSERGSLDAVLNQVEAAVAGGNYNAAIDSIDDLRDRVQARAGQFIANEWRATRDVDNQAGQMVAGANSLRFSVAYLRDFGQ